MPTNGRSMFRGQPRAHIMFFERRYDAVARDPEQYFKRYNSKAPEKGGAKKGYDAFAGQTRTAVERRDSQTREGIIVQRSDKQLAEEVGGETKVMLKRHQSNIEGTRRIYHKEYNGLFKAGRSPDDMGFYFAK